MKKLFTAIRHSDMAAVKDLIQKNPDLVNCVAKQPPKKDDGQSPLQVALKTGNLDIAEYLIDRNANISYMETASCSEWRAPVLHDAVIAAVMCSRWNTNDSIQGFQVYSTFERARQAYAILEKMIHLGADVNSLDSFGYSALFRFCLQAKQILPAYRHLEHREADDRIFTQELHDDLKSILQLLKKAGADPAYQAPILESDALSYFREGSLAVLLKEVFGDL